MKFEAMVNSKSYRTALASIDEYAMDGCHAILQATMIAFGKLESEATLQRLLSLPFQFLAGR